MTIFEGFQKPDRRPCFVIKLEFLRSSLLVKRLNALNVGLVAVSFVLNDVNVPISIFICICWCVGCGFNTLPLLELFIIHREPGRSVSAGANCTAHSLINEFADLFIDIFNCFNGPLNFFNSKAILADLVHGHGT